MHHVPIMVVWWKGIGQISVLYRPYIIHVFETFQRKKDDNVISCALCLVEVMDMRMDQ